MSESTATRWWENYLVRYFLPSLVGMIILRWLDENTNNLLSNYIPFGAEKFSTANLIVWLLFGSLYCYLASYPILVFHATRVYDFKDMKGNLRSVIFNPYTVTLALATAAFFSANKNSVVMIFISVIVFSAYQIYRLYKVYSTQKSFGFNKGYEASYIYAYLNKLSKRRGVSNEVDVSRMEDDEITVSSNQKRDLADSYRHLREHGNTAFIFLLEIALCPLIYVILNFETTYSRLSILSIMLFIWVFPSALVHLLGQHLERRYSLFKYDIDV